MAAKGIQFPRRWYRGMISANLEVIWVMSVQDRVVAFIAEFIKAHSN